MGLGYVLLLLFIQKLQKLQKKTQQPLKKKNKNRFGILRISEIFSMHV
jgi:hypothetical protein